MPHRAHHPIRAAARLRTRDSDRDAALDGARVEALVRPVRNRPPIGADPIGSVTRELYARLSDADLAELAAALEGDARAMWEQTPADARERLALVLCAHYALPGALQRTGLTAATPPADVHAMARGTLSAGGDMGIADLVVDSVGAFAAPPAEGATVLDFGCSSGRVLRALAAWRPDLECIGCDPNGPAIEWAQASLPMARFFRSPALPPLELDDASVDLAYAISIWSHFDQAPARAWLAEMHRVVKPGGHLLLTTHGLQTIADHLRQDLMTGDSAARALASMSYDGFQYYDVFGADGDWGVTDAGWGNSYLTIAWLAGVVTPQWSIRLVREGALASNQDVIVLERAERG